MASGAVDKRIPPQLQRRAEPRLLKVEAGNCCPRLWQREVQPGLSPVDLMCLLTRQHGDADGASLAERLHGGMLGNASVQPSIAGTHLPQRQLRGRQDPVITLREEDKVTQERKGE